MIVTTKNTATTVTVTIDTTVTNVTIVLFVSVGTAVPLVTAVTSNHRLIPFFFCKYNFY